MYPGAPDSKTFPFGTTPDYILYNYMHPYRMLGEGGGGGGKKSEFVILCEFE